MTGKAASRFPTKRLKHVVWLRRSRVIGGEGMGQYVGLENIEPWTGKHLSNSTAIDRLGGSSLNNSFESGDVLFGKLRPYLAKAWVAEFPGRASTEFLVMKPVEVKSRFLRYVLLWRKFIDKVDASTFGSKMPRAAWDRIGNISIPVPDYREQRSIVDLLDRETAKIDALIAAKQRMLRLLAEKRREVVTRTVTHGLDQNAPLRDSGIRWLGKIPAHWEIARLRYLVTRVEQGWSPQGENREPDHDEWGVLKLNAVRQGQYDSSATKALVQGIEPLIDLEIRRGDVLVTRSNTPSLVGDACFVESTRPNLMLCDLIYRLVVRHDVIDGRFLSHFLTSPVGRIQIEVDARGTSASMVKISQDHVKDWVVPLPPIREQQSLASRLSKEIQKINRVKRATEMTLAILTERRSAIIASVLTGQVDAARAV